MVVNIGEAAAPGILAMQHGIEAGGLRGPHIDARPLTDTQDPYAEDQKDKENAVKPEARRHLLSSEHCGEDGRSRNHRVVWPSRAAGTPGIRKTVGQQKDE